MESGAGKNTGGVMNRLNEVFCSRCADSDVTCRMSIWSLGWVLQRDYTILILDCLGKRPRHDILSTPVYDLSIYPGFDSWMSINYSPSLRHWPSVQLNEAFLFSPTAPTLEHARC